MVQVLHTDIDVIWLRDPAPYLMCSPEAEQGEFSAASRWPCAAMRKADVAVSSDNMSPGRDTQGHAAYSAGGTFNTGILFIRANEQGQAFAKAWHKNVADPERGSRFYGDTSDQQAGHSHNRILRATWCMHMVHARAHVECTTCACACACTTHVHQVLDTHTHVSTHTPRRSSTT